MIFFALFCAIIKICLYICTRERNKVIIKKKKAMKKVHEIENLRMIKVSFLGPTNRRGARIRIYETNRYNDEKTESKVFSYDYKIDNVQQQAFEILQANGFNVICKASEYGNYILLCDNWGQDFKKVSELK